jgi:Fic family protein
LIPIVTGGYRAHGEPMQIVTPRLGKPDTVHYEAPRSADVHGMMDELLGWFTLSHGNTEGLVRAAVAHLWFEAIHPFEDGNGRIGRAVAELALAQDMQSSQRLFSLSQQLWLDRTAYYAQLQAATGHARMDVTQWVAWFVERIEHACLAASRQMDAAVIKTRFWAGTQLAHPQLSASQRKVLGKLFDVGAGAFAGGLSTEKYVHMASVSRATAYRELTQMTELGLLIRTGQGRGTRYQLAAQAS